MTSPSPAKDLAGPEGSTAPAQDPAIVASLLSISKSTRAFLALFLAEIGLHPGQDQLLDGLELDRPVSVSVLADQLAVRPSTVSKMLDRMIDKGFVQRIASPGDGRRAMALLTPAGEAMRERIREVWQRLDGEFATALAPQDLARLRGSLAEAEAILAVRLRRLR